MNKKKNNNLQCITKDKNIIIQNNIYESNILNNNSLDKSINTKLNKKLNKKLKTNDNTTLNTNDDNMLTNNENINANEKMIINENKTILNMNNKTTINENNIINENIKTENKNTENLWINKYKPIIISDIIGNKEQINIFKKWLCDIKINKCQSILISGNQGLGKTLTIKLILEENNYIVRIINPNDIKDHRIYDDFNDYYNFINSIYSKINFKNNKNTKIALIFDETENITLTSEKKYVMDIYKNNNKLKSFPLIFISNNQHSKLLNDLKKNCLEINFKFPSKFELSKLIFNILDKENIKLENNIDPDILLNKIIIFSQFDIRRLINILQELSYHLINNTITNNNIDEFIEKSRKKNIDIGLFESTEKILNNYLDYETIIKLYESEKVLLPLMIHENYLKKILSVKLDLNNKLDEDETQLYCNNNCNNNWNNIIYNIVKISDSLSRGDNIETSIYTDQNWYLQTIHGFYTCINTSFWINKNNYNLIKKNKTSQHKLLGECPKININNIKFSADLNKTSLKNINRKNILNLSKIIDNKSNQEILMLNKICNYFIENNQEKKLINKLNGYNKDITIKEIELCLKIDKTTDFNILASKDKKRISKQINN
jgi:hypothetical protein